MPEHVANLRIVAPVQLASAARDCPALASARTLAEWVGTGREVTPRGVLRPAVAVEACDLLGIEPPSRRPRSALDIDELMAVWEAARAAGFIEVGTGRAKAGPGLRAWLDGDPGDVLAAWSASALECLGLADPTEPEHLEYLAVLATLFERGGTASLDDLGAGVSELTGSASPDCTCPDCAGEAEQAADMLRLLGVPGPDEVAGDNVGDLAEFGIAVLTGDGAELTPLGRWFTDVMFRQNAPAADVDAARLVGDLAHLPDMLARLLARPWLSARTATGAVRELLAVGGSTPGQVRLTALRLARACGPEAAPAWKEWAGEDGFGAYARVWLAEQDGAEPSDADETWITVDTFVTLIDALPPDLPEGLVPYLVRAQVGDGLDEILPLLEDSDHPDAARLAELLSGGPADPAGPPGMDGFAPAPRLRAVPDGRKAAGPARPGAAYQIKVQLRGVTKPPVWRRLQVPADLPLGTLHEVIQDAMGWENAHMHVFSDGRNDYGHPDAELGHQDERKVRLSRLLTAEGDQIGYIYDFGDDWVHDITLEKILPPGTAPADPVCVTGKGACPPEDCGGVWGYQSLKATLSDPADPDHEDMLDWLGLDSGDEFDPKEFSTEEVNRRLGHS